jgi:hypothetical protein
MVRAFSERESARKAASEFASGVLSTCEVVDWGKGSIGSEFLSIVVVHRQ